MYDNMIQDIGKWLDKYEYYSKLNKYLIDLNALINDIITNKINIPNKFKIAFALGSEIMDISDNHIVIGIHEDILYKYGKSVGNDKFYQQLFGSLNKLFKENENIGIYPHNVLTFIKSGFIKSFNVGTRKLPITILNQFCRLQLKDTKHYIINEEIEEGEKIYAIIQSTKQANGGYIESYIVSPFYTDGSRAQDLTVNELKERIKDYKKQKKERKH